MKIFLIILGFVVVVFGILIILSQINQQRFLKSARAKAAAAFAVSRPLSDSVITEEDLAELPAPVQRYLRYCQVIGKKRVRTVRLKMEGGIRLKPDQPFSRITAEEYYTVSPPALVWFGVMKMAPLLTVTGRDTYEDGQGNMWIKLLSTFTIDNAAGELMNEATHIRFLNEITWHPTSFLNDNISWETIDENSARVILTDAGRTVSAVVSFNEKGEMINFETTRFRSDTQSMCKWTTPLRDYQEFHGLRIPTAGEAIYHSDDGEFEYIRLKLVDIEYDVSETY